MQDFKELKVWRKSHELTLAVYRVTRGFPMEEVFVLKSQIRRSASSVAANIAEGCGRGNAAELGRYLRMASGSVSELEYHLLLSHDLRLLSDRDWQTLSNQAVDVRRMLGGLVSAVIARRAAKAKTKA